MPVELKNQLEESAKKSGRSLNAEILHLLQGALAENVRPKISATYYKTYHHSTTLPKSKPVVDPITSELLTCKAPHNRTASHLSSKAYWTTMDTAAFLALDDNDFQCTRSAARKQLEVYSHLLADKVTKPEDLSAVEVVMKALVSLVDIKASNAGDDDEAEFLLDPQGAKKPSGQPAKNYDEEL